MEILVELRLLIGAVIAVFATPLALIPVIQRIRKAEMDLSLHRKEVELKTIMTESKIDKQKNLSMPSLVDDTLRYLNYRARNIKIQQTACSSKKLCDFHNDDRAISKEIKYIAHLSKRINEIK